MDLMHQLTPHLKRLRLSGVLETLEIRNQQAIDEKRRWVPTGPDHPDVAMTLNNLAVLYKNQGRHAEAEPLYRRALAIFEEVLGPAHPHVETSRANLAQLLKDMG